MSKRLFDVDVPEREWVELRARGFQGTVPAMVFSSNNPPTCGMPLGGVATGCLDIDVDGTLGRCSLFKRFWGWDHRDQVYAPSDDSIPALPDGRAPLGEPFLGIAVSKQVTILSTRPQQGLPGVRRIRYFGHYPVVDVEYEMDGPVQVGLRAWSPFLPGDLDRSQLPGAVFEVHLRNTSTTSQSGAVAFSFPGLIQVCDDQPITKENVDVGVPGMRVRCRDSELVIAADDPDARFGDRLAHIAPRWNLIAHHLPRATQHDPGAAAAVDFTLGSGETRVVRFFLTWWTRTWTAHFPYRMKLHDYRNMYTTLYADSRDAAMALVHEHDVLLSRVLAWQSAIFEDEALPGWLRFSLISQLHLIAEDALWAVAEGDLQGDYYQEGLFALIESADAAGQTCCIPCDWYGNIPIVYFFPALAWSTLRGLRLAIREDGAVPFYFGQGLDLLGGRSGATAVPDGVKHVTITNSPAYHHDQQRTLNGCCYADLVDRLWMCTGDDAVLEEFYESVKQNLIYTVNLDTSEHGIISASGNHWYESMAWPGMASHVGGVRLAHIRMAERMAEHVGDNAFAEQCEAWFQAASRSMEEQLWCNGAYLLYKDLKTGEESDMVLAFQLDGDWMSYAHGLGPVFPIDRANRALDTIQQLNGTPTNAGALDIVKRDGSLTGHGGRMGGRSVMPASVFILAMNYLYMAREAEGLKMAEDCMTAMAKDIGMLWEVPNMFFADNDGADWVYGMDYYQTMSLWGLPAALAQTDMAGPCKTGGLVARVLAAAR